MNKVYSIDNLLVNKCEFLDKTLKYGKLELHTCTDRSVCNKHSTYPKGGVLGSKDSFLVNESSVFKSCFVVKIPPFGYLQTVRLSKNYLICKSQNETNLTL